MSVAVLYPTSLPSPSVATVQAVERRLLQDRPFGAVAFQRDRHEMQQFTLPPLTSAEMLIFESWWRDKLTFGGAWFAAPRWPLPDGMSSGVRRFFGPLTRQRLGGGYWRVGGQCEVRGRGLLPTAYVSMLVYTSWPYPVIVDEALSIGVSTPQAGQVWRPPNELLDLGLSLPLGGTLTTVLHTYPDAPPDLLDLGLSLPTGGTLVTVLHVYSDALPDLLDIGLSLPLGGTLTTVLVTYTNWPADTLDLGLSIPLGGTCA